LDIACGDRLSESKVRVVNFGTKTALTKTLNIQLFDIVAFTAEKHAPALPQYSLILSELQNKDKKVAKNGLLRALFFYPKPI